MDLKNILDEILMQVNNHYDLKESEQAYIQVASEASMALENLDRRINSHEIYRKCESFLLLELENLQQALDGAEKTIHGIFKRNNRQEWIFMSLKATRYRFYWILLLF